MLLLWGAGSAEAQTHASTAVSIVVAPRDRIVFTGAPAAVQRIGAEAKAGNSTVLRTAPILTDGGEPEAAQDICATHPNDDPAWLVRSSQLMVTRTAGNADGANRLQKLTCTLVAP